MNRVLKRCTLMLMLTIPSVFAADYYVSTTGSDSDPGTLAQPFATIQHAADLMGPGDTCYIRGGSYHEAVVMNNVDGASGSPITFASYNGEQVIIDGTEDISSISSGWIQHSGNIYKTTLTKDVWQLFVDDRLQITARWPNASTHPTDPVTRKPNSWKAEDGSWWRRSKPSGGVTLSTFKEPAARFGNRAYLAPKKPNLLRLNANLNQGAAAG